MASLSPVTRPEDLYGRYKELAQITAALLDGSDVVIEGIARIGKSSLLNVLIFFPHGILEAVVGDLAAIAMEKKLFQTFDEAKQRLGEGFTALAEQTDKIACLEQLYSQGKDTLLGTLKEISWSQKVFDAIGDPGATGQQDGISSAVELLKQLRKSPAMVSDPSAHETLWHMIFLAWALSRAQHEYEWQVVAFDFARDSGETKSTHLFWRSIGLQLGCPKPSYEWVIKWNPGSGATDAANAGSGDEKEPRKPRLLVLLDEYQSRDRFPLALNGEIRRWRESAPARSMLFVVADSGSEPFPDETDLFSEAQRVTLGAVPQEGIGKRDDALDLAKARCVRDAERVKDYALGNPYQIVLMGSTQEGGENKKVADPRLALYGDRFFVERTLRRIVREDVLMQGRPEQQAEAAQQVEIALALLSKRSIPEEYSAVQNEMKTRGLIGRGSNGRDHFYHEFTPKMAAWLRRVIEREPISRESSMASVFCSVLWLAFLVASFVPWWNRLGPLLGNTSMLLGAALVSIAVLLVAIAVYGWTSGRWDYADLFPLLILPAMPLLPFGVLQCVLQPPDLVFVKAAVRSEVFMYALGTLTYTRYRPGSLLQAVTLPLSLLELLVGLALLAFGRLDWFMIVAVSMALQLLATRAWDSVWTKYSYTFESVHDAHALHGKAS